MNLNEYDKVVYEKIKSVFSNTFYGNEEELITKLTNFDNQKEKKDDQHVVKLPMISICRTDLSINRSLANFTELHRGRITRYNNERTQVRTVSTVPVSLTYQMMLWSNKREQLNFFIQEMLFFLLRDPEVEVTLSPDGTKARFELILEDSIAETSTDYVFKDKGPLFKCPLQLSIPDVRLAYHDDAKTVLKIPVDYIVIEEGTKNGK